MVHDLQRSIGDDVQLVTSFHRLSVGGENELFAFVVCHLFDLEWRLIGNEVVQLRP